LPINLKKFVHENKSLSGASLVYEEMPSPSALERDCNRTQSGASSGSHTFPFEVPAVSIDRFVDRNPNQLSILGEFGIQERTFLLSPMLSRAFNKRDCKEQFLLLATT
jgi:hypothetical protein